MAPATFQAQLNEFLSTIRTQLLGCKNLQELNDAIVNYPFKSKLLMTYFDVGIIVLLRVNEDDQMIDRIALSKTELAEGAVRASAKPFHEIRIPFAHKENIIAKSIHSGKSEATEDWYYLFTPELTASQARRNQTSASVECSIVLPLSYSPGGALIFSFYQPTKNLNQEHSDFIHSYASLVSELLRNQTFSS
jgi:hypothetical protein